MTKKHVHTGYLEDLSDEQRVVLDRLRQHLREELANNDPRYDDRYLLRFCRARKFDYPKVQLMFDNFLKWRETNGVDNIAEMDISKIKESAELLPHNYYCLDRKGRPVYIERYGKFDLKEITKVALFDQIVDEQFLLRYYIYAYERLLHVVFPEVTKRNNGTVIEQSVTILDLDGLAFTKILSKRNEIQQFLKLTSGIAQDNYPEIMGKLFIINAPFLFSMLWSVVKSFLDEKTANKIQIIGGSYKKDLLKEISEEELPVFFGGKNATTLQDGCFKDLFQKAIEYKTFFIEEHEEKLRKEKEALANSQRGALNTPLQKPLTIYSSLSGRGLNRSMNESIIDDDDVFEEFEKDARLKHVFSSKVVKWSHHHRHPPSTNQNGQHMANKYSYGH